MITSTKRKIAIAALTCTAVCSHVSAQQNLTNSFSTIGTLVDSFTSSVIQSLGILCMSAAVAAFFFGVAQYINGMRGGDATKVKDGNLFMVWGLVALFVMFSIWGIIYFAQGLFGIQGMNDISKLFGGNIKAGTSYSTPLSPIGGGTNGSAVFQGGAGGVFQGGSAGGVGWTVGNTGGQAGFTIGGNGGSGSTGFGVGVSGNGVQSGGFMVNGVPAAQVPGVLSCNGRSAGAWCGMGMECALANDASMSCFRSVDIKAGKAITNAQAAVDPSKSGGANGVTNNAGADCTPEDKNACTGGTVCVAYKCAFSTASQMGPTEKDIPASSLPGYKCTPSGASCTLPTGGEGICSSDEKACITPGSTYNPDPVTPADYTPPATPSADNCMDFNCQ